MLIHRPLSRYTCAPREKQREPRSSLREEELLFQQSLEGYTCSPRARPGGDAINTRLVLLASGQPGPPLPVVGPLLFGLLQGLVHGLLVLPSTFGAVPLALGFMVQPHAGEVEPLDGALVIVTAEHLSIGDLIAQTVRGLVRVNGKVRRGCLPLGFGLGAFLLLGGLPLLLLRRSGGDVIMVVIISCVFPILVVALSPGPLAVRLFCLRDCLSF